MRRYNYAFFDEVSKREIRRATLKAIAIPGYQVPLASRELPIARGWGTGGLQLTLSLVTPEDTVKVIDQGMDESVNAVNIKAFIQKTTDVATTVDTKEATLIQSRHRIPDRPLEKGQIMVLQVPMPEPLRHVERSERKTKILHADADYSGAYVKLFEDIMKYKTMATGADHPVTVNHRYVMAPSPIPKFDNPKMHRSKALILLGAGREKKIYAVPPYTDVVSLHFEDYPFVQEDQTGRRCLLCGQENIYFDELQDANGTYFQCNDTSECLKRQNEKEIAHEEK